MKKIKFASLFILSIIMFSVSSCDDEPLEGDFGLNEEADVSCVEAVQNLATASTNFVNATDDNYTSLCNAYVDALQDQITSCGDTGGTLQLLIDSLGDCSNGGGGNSEGDYWPRAINNSWTYNSLNGSVETYEISAIETIDGNEYFYFDNFLGASSWLRKEGVNYYIRSVFSGHTSGYDFVSTPLIITMIKDDAEVGATWQNNPSYTISYTPTVGLPDIPDTDVTAVYSFEMLERDITRQVEGVSYENVIHIELSVSASGQTSVVQYYYAKDIGLIDYITPSGSVTLLDYTLN